MYSHTAFPFRTWIKVSNLPWVTPWATPLVTSQVPENFPKPHVNKGYVAKYSLFKATVSSLTEINKRYARIPELYFNNCTSSDHDASYSYYIQQTKPE